MNSTLNKVVRPWGAGGNLNDFRDGTNTTRNFQKKIQGSDMLSDNKMGVNWDV